MGQKLIVGSNPTRSATGSSGKPHPENLRWLNPGRCFARSAALPPDADFYANNSSVIDLFTTTCEDLRSFPKDIAKEFAEMNQDGGNWPIRAQGQSNAV
jgi:hypothetical protein